MSNTSDSQEFVTPSAQRWELNAALENTEGRIARSTELLKGALTTPGGEVGQWDLAQAQVHLDDLGGLTRRREKIRELIRRA